jgi:hypothetical protein
MKVFTTINPYGNFDTQREAILSWCKEYDVYSVNGTQEIDVAKDLYPEVTFIQTENTYQIGKKNLIKLDAILDAIKSVDTKKCAIVNSDIILNKKIKLNKKFDDSLIIATRWELGDVPSYPFGDGYDLFIFDKRNIDLFYNKNYVIGMPWWDFWLPIVANRAGVDIYHIKNEIINHRTHKTNYDYTNWTEFASFFYSDMIKLGGLWKIDESIVTANPDPYLKNKDGEFCTQIKKFIESNQINIKL